MFDTFFLKVLGECDCACVVTNHARDEQLSLFCFFFFLLVVVNLCVVDFDTLLLDQNSIECGGAVAVFSDQICFFCRLIRA